MLAISDIDKIAKKERVIKMMIFYQLLESVPIIESPTTLLRLCIERNPLSQPSIRKLLLLGRVCEHMTLSHQNVWILGNIYTVFQFRVLSNNHNKIEIYFAKSIFLSVGFSSFSIAGYHI